jgi:hypothetical protein
MYKTTNFSIKELVHPKILASIGEDNSWARLDEGCLIDLDKIRDAWGDDIYINIGASYSRGLRPPNDPNGAYYSVHKQGKAFDLVPKNGATKALYNMVMEMISDGLLNHFNSMEDHKYTATWVHVAKMNTHIKPWIIKP